MLLMSSLSGSGDLEASSHAVGAAARRASMASRPAGGEESWAAGRADELLALAGRAEAVAEKGVAAFTELEGADAAAAPRAAKGAYELALEVMETGLSSQRLVALAFADAHPAAREALAAAAGELAAAVVRAGDLLPALARAIADPEWLADREGPVAVLRADSAALATLP